MNNIKTRITKDFLQSLNPCRSRWYNYLENYPEWEGSVKQFVRLSKITESDKFWVLWNHDFLTLKQKRELACNFAEHVLHFFEDKYPNDDRPRKAIAAARSGDKYATDAAWAAADAAAWAAWAAAYAARAAADAAAYAVDEAAAYAADEAAAYADDDAAAYADDDAAAYAARELERKYQIDLIIKILERDYEN